MSVAVSLKGTCLCQVTAGVAGAALAGEHRAFAVPESPGTARAGASKGFPQAS